MSHLILHMSRRWCPPTVVRQALLHATPGLTASIRTWMRTVTSETPILHTIFSRVDTVLMRFQRVTPALSRFSLQYPEVLTYEFPSTDKAESPDPYISSDITPMKSGESRRPTSPGQLCPAPISNSPAVSYEWFCDGQSIYFGGCLLGLDKAGHYQCQVGLKTVLQVEDSEPEEVSRVSNVVQVVKLAGRPTQVVPVTSKDNPKHGSPQEIQMSDLSSDFTQAINHASFGDVYRGRFNEMAVAVKRMKMKHGKRPEKMITMETMHHTPTGGSQTHRQVHRHTYGFILRLHFHRVH